MSRITPLTIDIKPFAPKRVQPNIAHTAAADASMAQQVQALWYQRMGTSREWNYLEASTAAIATMSAKDTDYTFSFTGSPDFALPWYVQKGFSGIEVALSVGTIADVPGLRVKVSVDDLAGGSEVEQPYLTPTSAPMETRPNWDGYFKSTYVSTFSVSPPANRIIKITPKCATTFSDEGYGTSFSWTVRVLKVKVRDVIINPGV